MRVDSAHLVRDKPAILAPRENSRTLFYSFLHCEFDVASDARTVFGVDHLHPHILAREDVETKKCARYFCGQKVPVRGFVLNEKMGFVLVGNFQGDLFLFQIHSNQLVRRITELKIEGLASGASLGSFFLLGDNSGLVHLVGLSRTFELFFVELEVNCKIVYSLLVCPVGQVSIFCGGSFRNSNVVSVFHFS